jgi:hypothetical protein
MLHADDAPAAAQPTLQLGTVEVQGNQQVLATLQAIKLALKAPYSNDPAHANDPVCRIEKQLGETREYLDCATNRDLIKRRDATQLAVEIGTLGVPGGSDLLRSFLARQPDHRVHMPVNGAALQDLLTRIPDAPVAVPATATQAAPKPVPATVIQKDAPQAADASANPPPTTQWR